MDSLFFQLGAAIVVATLLGMVCHRFKQPLLFAYLVTGILIGAVGQAYVANQATLNFFGDLGIAFLLFLVGLELNVADIRRLGKVAVLTALGQMSIAAGIALLLALALGFSWIASGYIALALTFSSTIIAVKYLADQRTIDALHGRISLGLLLVQDAVALAALIILSSLNSGGGSGLGWLDGALMLSKGATFIVGTMYISRNILPRFFRAAATSTELLLLGSIGWCVIGAATAQALGFSVEIGAFLAGLGLSSSSYQFQIAASMKPLRDFFVTLFFIVLGLQISLEHIQSIILPAALLSLVVIVVTPTVVATLLGRFGYKRHTAFFSAILLGQIGEFALVLAALGLHLGHLTSAQASLITAVVLISILVNSILTKYQEPLYRRVRPLLSWLEHGQSPHQRRTKQWHDHVVLLGAHKLGGDILSTLKHLDAPVVVVDFDPERIARLDTQGYGTIFGDVTDESVLEEAQVDQARLVVSTIEYHQPTIQLLRHMSHLAPTVPVIVTSLEMAEALEYYRLGAEYVIIPMLLGGHAIAQLVHDHWANLDAIQQTKITHLQNLVARHVGAG